MLFLAGVITALVTDDAKHPFPSKQPGPKKKLLLVLKNKTKQN